MTEQNGSAIYVALEDRGVVSLTGEDTIDFLQGLISNDVSQVTADRSIYATLLTPQGKFLFDFIISAWPGGVLLDVEAGRRADLIKRLTMYKLRSKVEIADLSDTHAVFAAFGGADPAPALGLPAEAGVARPLDDGVALVDPRMGELGVRIIAPADAAKPVLEEAGFSAGGAEDYERHRLALGVPDGGRDIVADKSFLLESNVEELNGISFDKGCFVGQELTARTKHRGVVRKRIFQVQCDGPLPQAGTAIMRGEVEAGTMRSGIDHMGLALLRLEHVEAATESGEPLTAGDTKVTAVKPAWVNF